MWMGGVNAGRLPDRITTALTIQWGRKGTIKLGGKTYQIEDLRKLINDLGIRGKGWIGADVPKTFVNNLDDIIKGKKRFLNPISSL